MANTDNLIEYIIPMHYAYALINADNTGLNEAEIKELDEFQNDVNKEHGNASFIHGGEENDLGFCHNDVNSLGGDATKLFIRADEKCLCGRLMKREAKNYLSCICGRSRLTK